MNSEPRRPPYALVFALVAAAMAASCAATKGPAPVEVRVEQAQECAWRLTRLDGAVQQWAYENQKKLGDQPTWDDLAPYLKEGVPLRCPEGHEYAIPALGEYPICPGGYQLDRHGMPLSGSLYLGGDTYIDTWWY